MDERILEIQNIDVDYGDVRVLTEVSLDVTAVEVVPVIGLNGTGKSQLCRRRKSSRWDLP